MKPILFSESATVFDTNGLGRLDCISCVVVEERNGEYTLSMEIAETALHASEIRLSSIIVAKPSEGATLQAFRVYKITKPLAGKFTVLAQHISYQLSYIPTMPFEITASPQACAQTLAALKSNAVESCPFNFSTDVSTASSYSQNVPASIRSRLGGVEGSVLDQFGGEYEWDNYNVILHKSRGVMTPIVSLRYGKNITDLNQETNIENTITGIVPYWLSSDGSTRVTLSEKVIRSANASKFPFQRTVPMDFSQDFQEQPTEDQLRVKAQAYIGMAGIGIPKVSIKVSFIHLADTEEYKNLAALQTVKLCDEVEVYFEKLDIATTAKIVRTEYDVLLEKYNSVEIGDLRSTLSGVISSTEGALSQVVNDTRKMFKTYNADIEEEIDNATAWLTNSNGYVIAVKYPDSHPTMAGKWKELVFSSEPDLESTTANVLRINENGMGFSSTGYRGKYTQGWTLDGKILIGGTNVPSLTVWEHPGEDGADPSGKILFQINTSGIRWDATNSEMTTSGKLTIKGLGEINGSTIKLGENGSNPGSITVYDGNGTEAANIIGTWNKGGITVNKGVITGTSFQVGGNGDNPGSITIYDKNNSGYKLVLDDSGTIKAYNGTSLKNYIDMLQPSSGDTHFNVKADKSLNLITPQITIANTEADATAGRAKIARSGTNKRLDTVRKIYLSGSSPDPARDQYYSDTGYDLYDHMREGYVPFYQYDEATGNYNLDGYVNCVLPVMLVSDGDTENLMHGMVTSNDEFAKLVIDTGQPPSS